MFRPGAALPEPPDPKSSTLAAALAAFGIGPGAASEVALQIWAFSHGLASLERAGRLPLPAERLIDSGVGRLLRGFGTEQGKPGGPAPR
jgi:hypothetical protein